MAESVNTPNADRLVDAAISDTDIESVVVVVATKVGTYEFSGAGNTNDKLMLRIAEAINEVMSATGTAHGCAEVAGKQIEVSSLFPERN